MTFLPWSPFFFWLHNFFLLEFNCFTMLCFCYTTKRISYMYTYISSLLSLPSSIYPLHHSTTSHTPLGHHRAVGFPVLYNSFPSYLFYIPQWLINKESACQCKRCVFNPRVGKSPGERNGDPLQYPCLGNPMDRGALWATVHGVANTT